MTLLRRTGLRLAATQADALGASCPDQVDIDPSFIATFRWPVPQARGSGVSVIASVGRAAEDGRRASGDLLEPLRDSGNWLLLYGTGAFRPREGLCCP